MSWVPPLDATTLIRVIFFASLPFILFAPPRWALLAWLITTNLDATGPSSAVNSSVGWINATKAVGFPVFLLFRMHRVPGTFWKRMPAVAWMLLTGYAAIATLWSSYPLAAVKMVGNLVGVFLAILALEKFVRVGLLDVRLVEKFTLATLLLGILQTSLYRGTVFGYDGIGRPARLTSFVAAQPYAALLVALLASLLWLKPQRASYRYFLILALLVALYFNGSRTWSIGAVIVIVIYLTISRKRTVGVTVLAGAGLALLGLVFLNSSLSVIERNMQSESRVVATLSKLFNGAPAVSARRIRNLPFRLRMDEGVLDALSASDTRLIIFGHGTSDGGEIPQTVFPRNYPENRVDPNRAIHNEWLRVLYEWGLVGLLCWSLVFLGIVVTALHILPLDREQPWAEILLSYLPALVLALAVENILAGAGTVVTIGFSIPLAGLAGRARPSTLSGPATDRQERQVAWSI